MVRTLYYVVPFIGMVAGVVYALRSGRGVVSCAVVGAVSGLIVVFAVEFTGE